MDQNTGFNFTEIHKGNQDQDFKKQRQIYLAERNARKKEAQRIVQKDFGRSSSSEGEEEVKRQPVLIKANINLEGSNTDSSQNSPKEETSFKKEREKYKNERLARRHEAIINKKIEFGSSSSEDESVPVHPKARVAPELKVEVSPRHPFKEEEPNAFGFASLEMGLAREKEPRSAMLASVKLKDKHSDRKETKQRYEVEVPSKKGVNIWIERWLQIKENSIVLGERTIPIYDISKVKLIIQPTQTGSFKIKLTVKEEDIFLAVNSKKMNDLHFLDQYYFVFAKIVSLKLQLMGKKALPPARVKEGISEQVLKEARLTGKVRKSSFFGGWEEKIGVISNSGLAIYKQGKDKANLIVTPGSIRQIWTRFQAQRDNLVLKFLNGSSKLQLSVPVQNFLSRDNWLYQIYTLTPK